MALFADDRAQSIQVGAVLLFAILILAFSTYQAVIVPEQNRRVEFDHNQEAQSQLGELRDRILATQDGGGVRSTTVDLGTRYPSRAIALNPTSPSGSLRTVGTTDPAVNLTIDNAVAGGETGDYWKGEPRHYDTGAITYEPAYHNYDEAPTTAYEHSVLYNDFDGESLVLANQSFVQGTTISLVTLTGSLERTSSTATSVDTRPLSSSDRTVLLDARSSSDPITLNFTSRLDDDRWRTILSGEDTVQSVDSAPAAGGFNGISVKLDPGPTYELEMTKAGVGTGLSGEDAAYLTDVSGGGSVQQGNDEEIVLEVRDAYNNPVRGVTVNGNVTGTSLGQEVTGSDGRASFTFDSDGVSPGTSLLNFTTNDSAVLATRPFASDRVTNATVEVDVTTATAGGGTGGGAYELNWTAPNTESANCDNEECTWDVGAGGDDSLRLNATVDPTYNRIDIEFAVDNSTVATVAPDSGRTDSAGATQTTLMAAENGTVTVLGSANEGSDEIDIDITNRTGLEPSAADIVQYVSGSAEDPNDDGGVDFELENTGSDPVTIQNVTVTSTTATDAQRVFENQGGSSLEQREFGFDGSDDGYHEAGDVWNEEGVPIGTTASLTDTASMSGGTTMTVTMRNFVEEFTWQDVDMSGEEITVEIGYSDGSTGTYTFTPT